MKRSPRSILLVSDTHAMNAALEAVLGSAGFLVAGPAISVMEALLRILDQDIDAALVDVAVGGEPTSRVLDVLAFANMPFALATAHPRSSIPSRHSHRPAIVWPCGPGEIAGILAEVLAGAGIAPIQTEASWSPRTSRAQYHL